MKPIPGAMVGSQGNPLIYKFPPNYLYHPTYDWDEGIRPDVFWLVFPTFVTMGLAAVQNQQVQVPNEADFEVRRILFHVDAALAQVVVAAVIVPNMTIQIFAQGQSRALMNAPAPLASVASSEASYTPRDLVWPLYLQRNDSITVTLTNFDAAAATNNVRITFAGRKIFPKSGQ